ncbi:MAG: hypothetical protein KDC52_06425, partial [Ignavibacteriae bacterium]|nr:hypothetical protein [Ignavibacteriota bacterium]
MLNYSYVKFILILIFLIFLESCTSILTSYKSIEAPIMTKWASEVSPDNALPEYPRPQLVRQDWLNLNGPWEYSIVSLGSSHPKEYQGEILVPYPIESALSGVA